MGKCYGEIFEEMVRMGNVEWGEVWEGILESVYMSVVWRVFAFVFGVILGVLVFLCGKSK